MQERLLSTQSYEPRSKNGLLLIWTFKIQYKDSSTRNFWSQTDVLWGQ